MASTTAGMSYKEQKDYHEMKIKTYEKVLQNSEVFELIEVQITEINFQLDYHKRMVDTVEVLIERYPNR